MARMPIRKGRTSPRPKREGECDHREQGEEPEHLSDVVVRGPENDGRTDHVRCRTRCRNARGIREDRHGNRDRDQNQLKAYRR